MKKKILFIFLSLACTFCLALGLSACDSCSSDSTPNNGDQTGDSADEDSSNTDDSSFNRDETENTHIAGEIVIENEVEATCITAGSYDSVVYCSICGKELSRENITIPATGEHIYGENNKCTMCGISKPSEGLEYSLSDDGESYTVGGIGTCTDTDIVILSTYEDLPVTSISERAFAGCVSITSIIIPDSVTVIGNYAFQSCTSLKSVSLGDSVTTIGGLAFQNCISLESVIV